MTDIDLPLFGRPNAADRADSIRTIKVRIVDFSLPEATSERSQSGGILGRPRDCSAGNSYPRPHGG